ncbi:anti-sigma factor [Marixanthomonas spongiae]|uniref:Anti-sigma factor n=1 Tax=Marixanthomonas spongiae TaxID=2174845 RepID=A0A2U0HS00_9FLAO|nr:anti-sigma factor [Marixanthomonas spongiae]PVW11609.1 anti-sigma factor [Marixanthomonas spongiae]
MNAQELIESGNLELYVAGSLSAEEAKEVEDAIEQHPEVKEQVELIEDSVITLAEAVSPPLSALIWSQIVENINRVRSISERKPSTNWGAITGWAAAILALAGIFWMLKEKNDLQDRVRYTTTQNAVLEEKANKAESQLAEAEDVLDIVRSKEYNTYTLPGNQAVAPQSFAKVYLNKKDKIAYIDAKGLPEPPRGKVYQVWSLTMQPLTPTSVGLLDSYAESDTKLFRVDMGAVAATEAFGITLEPEGGSETPTMDQLYTLGKVTP